MISRDSAEKLAGKQACPPLECCVQDARDFVGVLVEHYGFRRENVIELYDEAATRKAMLSTLAGLRDRVKEHQNLVIFFAGHGQEDRKRGLRCWIPLERAAI